MTDARYEAVVVGAGHNGLVCALYLARAGWKVLVLERNERVGGSVMSGEVTRPGFVHDLYAMNQNLFLGSPVYAELGEDLERHGLRYARVLTDGERVAGVELASGERIGARRAVVANLAPSALFGQLLPDHALPARFRRRVRSYEHGPGTMMVHLALRGRPRWRAGEDLDEFAYVHVAPYVEDLAQTYTDSLNGYLPSSPMLVVGQTSVVDPSRAPGDGEVLWVQVRTLPPDIRGDAKGEIAARDWEEARQPYADRVMEKLEEYAPGIGDLVMDRTVYSPQDLQRHNPNLVGGDSLGGSHHLRQNFVFRPFPGWSNYKMPVENLYMVGAATWPGAGTNATSGYLAAKKILRPHPIRERLAWGGAILGAGAAAAATARLLGKRRKS